MVIVLAILAAAITGGLFALMARTQGVDHTGILVAIAVIGGGLQMLALVVWYGIYSHREQKRHPSEERRDE